MFFLFGRAFNVDSEVTTDTRWHHVCIAWFSRAGNWTFYIDGVQKAAGAGLAANYSTELGYLIIGELNGSLTGFNLWDEYIADHSRIQILAHACSSLTGNIVPWPEIQIWRIGNVGKKNSTLCTFSGKGFFKVIRTGKEEKKGGRIAKSKV